MIQSQQRIACIDAMRGFSLLGILMANMLAFQYGMYGSQELTTYYPFSHDSGLHHLLKVFVIGSFMPIFAFLFGYSLIKMKEGLESKGLQPKGYLVRRFSLLVVLGWIHATYVWEGDILFAYGLIGFFLLMFINRKRKTILAWGVILLVVTSLMGYGMNNSALTEGDKLLTQYIEDTNLIYSSGTYGEVLHHRIHENPYGLPSYGYVLIFLILPFFTAPLFLIGMYAAKRKAFHSLQNHKITYLVAGSSLAVAGILMKASSLLFPEVKWTGVLEMLGGSVLSLGYIFLFVFLYAVKGGGKLFQAFESVGRLSLTNYLMQSLICTTLFYGYGVGWFGKIGLLNGVLLSFAIYGLQLVCSYWYLKWRKAGPFEKIMRMWTYFSWSAPSKEISQSK